MRIFIAYTNLDKPFAERLKQDLSKQGMDVQTADDILHLGDIFPDKIAKAIAKADAFIIILSRESSGRSWLSYELAAALTAQSKGQLRAIMPIIIEKGTEIPFALRDRLYKDFSDPHKYSEAFQSLISSLRDSSTRTREQISESLIRQREVALSAQKSLRLEQMDYKRVILHRNIRIADSFAFIITMVFIAFFTASIVFFLRASTFSWWFVAITLFVIGVLIFNYIWMSRQFRKLRKLREKINHYQGKNSE